MKILFSPSESKNENCVKILSMKTHLYLKNYFLIEWKL